MEYIAENWIAISQAIFTLMLVALTYALVRATNLLASRSSEPLVVAQLELIRGEARRLQLIITNTGNATAFDIKTEFSPELPKLHKGKDLPKAIRKISVLRPSQSWSTVESRFEDLHGKEFTARVSWTRTPGSKRESLSYKLNIDGMIGIWGVHSRGPEERSARSLEKISQYLDMNSRGWRPFRVSSDGHTTADGITDEQDQEPE